MQRSPLTFAQQSPVLLAGFAFMLGIAAAHAAWRPAAWLLWPMLLACACAAALCGMRKRWQIAAALIATAALGALDAQIQSLARHNEATLSPYCDRLLYSVTGTVVRAGLTHVSDGKPLQSVDIAVNTIDRYGDTHVVPSAIRASILLDGSSAPLRYGMVVRMDTQLHLAQRFRDPGVWDRRDWLAQQGISALTTTKRKDIEVLGMTGGTRFGRSRDAVRTSLLQHLHQLSSSTPHPWTLNSEDVALLEEMMLGERAELEQSDRLDFQRTGSFHLLVVSGMNIAIFAAVIFWTMRKLPFGDTAACVLTALFAV